MTALTANRQHRYWLDILLLTVVFGLLFFLCNASRPLFVPDEGRYAEIAREMMVKHDFITPYLNNIKYFEKPILFYWLEVGAAKLGGMNLFSLRSVNALLALLLCLGTYITGRKLFDRNTGLLSAFALGTSTLYFLMAHMITLDMAVTVFVNLSLFAFLLGVNETASHRKWYFYSAYTCAALAVLTKGLIGIVFPAMIIGAWIITFNQWRILTKMYLPSGILLFLTIAAPWHLLVGHRNPEFVYFYFIEQQFLRYTNVDIGHYQPFWFFIPNILLGFIPWIVVLPAALLHACRNTWSKQRLNEGFLLLTALLIFVFFSFSKSKLIPYILPVFPALAIMTGHYLAWCLSEKRVNEIASYMGGIALIAAFLFFGFRYFTHHTLLPDNVKATIYLTTSALILLTGSLLALVITFRNIFSAYLTLVTASMGFLLFLLAAVPSIDTRTILPLANLLKPRLHTADHVVTYNLYYQDLPFYLDRTVSILNWQNELSFGMQHGETKSWMLDDKAFWALWNSDQQVYVFMNRPAYQRLKLSQPRLKFSLIGETITNILISNKAK